MTIAVHPRCELPANLGAALLVLALARLIDRRQRERIAAVQLRLQLAEQPREDAIRRRLQADWEASR